MLTAEAPVTGRPNVQRFAVALGPGLTPNVLIRTMNGEAAGARRAGFSLTTHCEAGDRREVTFEIADLKLAASAITFNLRPDHAPQDANSTSRVWAISAAVSVTAPVTAEATKIGPSAFLVWWRCVSSCDVLDLLGYILVAVFQRRLVLDHRFASGR